MAHSYPPSYRQRELDRVRQALAAGDSAAICGLSGAGKSNALRCLAEYPPTDVTLTVVDANALVEPTADALFEALAEGLAAPPGTTPLTRLRAGVAAHLKSGPGRLTLVIDRFEAVAGSAAGPLRALRDLHKYRLSYAIGLRRPMDATNELAELFFGTTLWLGPLSEADAAWTIDRFCARRGLKWPQATITRLQQISGRYPSFLRAACEAHAADVALDPLALAGHPAVRARLNEFWADQPTEDELLACALLPLPPIAQRAGETPAATAFDDIHLTAKESQLLNYLRARPGAVCTKDELIRAVWPEDAVFTQGVRDDALAQLVRRLREKIEPDPASPRHVLTSPGRGYRFSAG
ncbi:MAG: winged helix-turn-helix domain-containing protein [Anaerolineales bacterium]|nr:winged helix-turn-helix domain-containing protein [Anaerolineales bacterium]